jgi:hypothetical protein
MKIKISLLQFLLLLSLSVFAQNPEENKASRQFDFWLGEWQVYTNDEMVGTNTIVALQNGNVLQENWVSEKQNFTGTSYNFYNPKDDKWHQVWVDKNGNNLILEGKYFNGKMVLQSTGNSFMGEDNSIHRITWELMPIGHVKQTWESSTDKGKNWSIQFQGIYKKKLNQ